MIEFPDLATLDPEVVAVRKLDDDVPQTGDAQRATLFLERARR